ncbi:ribosome biogenesis GTPase Der [Candidatus Falkowbacteria bacterium CG_4_9_14_3_um_filter_36_9]|uniref:GTPase Der n=2 Tax=Candidatus Falkowiibacteriota TaxID=1752728 RepID=A0A1J4T4V2_9BACT|nr:MAG: ribosome biogenesis GTPase Der [Candidatus Falkowbacteria bacterium CG1_02_37_44]PIV51896.1 MAG: ribosome biogenesis GTPase Der [Candidatus Falkowbacteria bacterium CG02_land_8_20_14_3_00_36_14]PIX11522.1 MAG: ribosome biogenesis GTPase Der [Candidatus Falkowbacteria bacterium CG_4_8_14_3_um_filter_36_11]PJA10280.1 MAG: ribosome biogenesis GTPase Der [Candidatus Falkowbacteria bacterium CG_4_10_14_0_2_um_filter_36_22]PJB19076.1 MAG: ribosome biogenesis GTPase Der [Candidatus Falkowbacte
MNYKENLPTVIIFGRTNVGKSTLFNCLTEKNKALVSKIEGTTRDSNIGEVEWCGRAFTLIDTGGIINLPYLIGKKITADNINNIDAQVQKQARDFLTRADLILFLVDTKAGLLPMDKQMSLILKKITNKKKFILVANKADSMKQREKIAEFYKLSLGDPIPVSAVTGSGTGDLLDIIIKKIAETKSRKSKSLPKEEAAGEKPINVCLLGRPNVGKSSLFNKILGYERVIVSKEPHTTREPQDTLISYLGHPIKFIDTAGISKEGKKIRTKTTSHLHLIKEGINKSLLSLNKADIALFILDISQTITHQDSKIIEEIINRKKSLIIIANKWDLINAKDTKKFKDIIYGKLPFIRWVPIQFISSLTGAKINKIMEIVMEIKDSRQKEITDNQLSKFLNQAVKIHRPVKGKGVKHPYIYYLKQTRSNPPEFELRIGAKDNIHFSYIRFIENRLRKKFGFIGTPVTIRVTKNTKVHGREK